MVIKCFLLEPTPRIRLIARAFESSREGVHKCHGPVHSSGNIREYHNCEVIIGDYAVAPPDADAMGQAVMPKQCDSCGHVFTEAAHHNVDTVTLYRRSDTQELTTLQTAPAGAMWLATWYPPEFGGPVHQRERPGQPHLIVRTPAGEWDVDSKSSNGDGWSVVRDAAYCHRDAVDRRWSRQ